MTRPKRGFIARNPSKINGKGGQMTAETVQSEVGFWTATEHQEPPQDGSQFWAWLHHTGVRCMVWDPDFYEDDGAYVLAGGDEDYEPDFWAPLSAIPDPADEFAHLRVDEPR